MMATNAVMSDKRDLHLRQDADLYMLGQLAMARRALRRWQTVAFVSIGIAACETFLGLAWWLSR